MAVRAEARVVSAQPRAAPEPELAAPGADRSDTDADSASLHDEPLGASPQPPADGPITHHNSKCTSRICKPEKP